jgi:hypothetical protein
MGGDLPFYSGNFNENFAGNRKFSNLVFKHQLKKS